MYYQERVAVIWIEKVKAMGSCALDGVERGRGSAEDRVILADVRATLPLTLLVS